MTNDQKRIWTRRSPPQPPPSSMMIHPTLKSRTHFSWNTFRRHLIGFLKSVLSFALVLFVYLYPILRGLISLWLRHIGSYTFSKIFFNQDRRRRKRQKPLPKLHMKSLSANASYGNSAFSWDTDGIPFVVYNYDTSIRYTK